MNPILTFQTRISLNEADSSLLDQCAVLLSTVERTLFAAIMAGKSSSSLKPIFLKQFNITARHFNGCRIQVEGKIQSLKEIQKNRIEEMQALLKNPKLKPKRQTRLQKQLDQLLQDQDLGKVRYCFGSKKLFHAQFHLEQSGYTDHQEWYQEWNQTRNNQFFLIGSKDETSGNQSCTATIQPDEKITLRIRLPSSIGKYLEIRDVQFKYGHDRILASIRSCQERAQKKDRSLGEAVSYRFQRDAKGWRVFASTSIKTPNWITHQHLGVIGIDINADHLALVETDRFGNPIYSESIPLVLYGKTADQASALIGDACSRIIAKAIETQKPIVIEKLDFKEKKRELANNYNKRYARMLSSFAYNKICLLLKSRSFREGVHLHQVKAAFTSLIGRVKFAKRYGLTIHQAAALCIGRRFLGYSEQPPRHLDQVPDGKGCYMELPLPVRNRGKHVWHFWRKIGKAYQVVHAAHLRSAKPIHRSASPACETKTKLEGETPSHESSAELLGRRVHNISRTCYV